jgi:two-component system response regulator AtoC
MTEHPQRVLLVDDDAAVRTVLAALLRQAGVESVEADSAARALERLAEGSIDVLITDLRMPGMDGMALLGRSLEIWPDVPVIMLTAHGSVPLAVEATRRGAFEFVLKPFDRQEVLSIVERALLVARQNGARPELAAARKPALLGDSPRMAALRSDIRRAASSQATVLIHGENGTGKELVARAIHDESPRRAAPFVKLNCAAIPESLIESEIFGYEKGAFTGATKQKPGRVELAEGGTLFLDEIGDYSAAVQVKLLRVLQERELTRLGGTATFAVDVRFVAATNKDLQTLVARGSFREDLYYRLNVLPIDVPALRERTEDIARFARAFTLASAKANDRSGVELEAAAVERMIAAPWPGNVRQLENFVERLVVFSDGPRLTLADVERELGRDAARARASQATPVTEPDGGLAGARRQAERDAIREALALAGGNRTRAARILGMSRRTLYNKLSEYDLG